MKGAVMSQCHICGKNIDPANPHFVLLFNKETIEDGQRKILHSAEGIPICGECGEEGFPSVLRHFKIIHDADTELEKKMAALKKSVDMLEMMKLYGISGEKAGTKNQYLTKCPFHNQDASFLIDARNKEYFCFCEGLNGDMFSFVINYDRDVNHKHTTLKQAVDFLLKNFPVS